MFAAKISEMKDMCLIRFGKMLGNYLSPAKVLRAEYNLKSCRSKCDLDLYS
jgi:hypothetical protein